MNIMKLAMLFFTIMLSYQVMAGDFETVIEYFQFSAEQGYTRAQTLLEVMYYYGLGVNKDYMKSKVLFNQACDNGSNDGV